MQNFLRAYSREKTPDQFQPMLTNFVRTVNPISCTVWFQTKAGRCHCLNISIAIHGLWVALSPQMRYGGCPLEGSRYRRGEGLNEEGVWVFRAVHSREVSLQYYQSLIGGFLLSVSGYHSIHDFPRRVHHKPAERRRCAETNVDI